MRAALLGAILLLGLLPGPGAARGAPPDLLARFQCQRCHEGTGLRAAPREQHCVRCHRDILDGKFDAPAEALGRWRGHIHSLTAVPSLTAIGARLRRGWVEQFLLQPHDLRPRLPALMPRLALTPEEARALAARLVPAEPPTNVGEAEAPASAAELREGRDLLDGRGCGACHAFSGVAALRPSPIPVPLRPEQLRDGMLLAPDLRHTRARFQRGVLVRWLQRPRALKPDALMPEIPLTEAQARRVAAYLLHAPLSPPPEPPLPPRLPVLQRRVGFDEVNERVFRRSCWHCHSAPDYALGDGGPGNTGGFGFRPRGLSFADYADVSSGSLDDQGRRRSIFTPLPDGTPRLLAHLLARQRELRGELVPGVRGMPLGLPALSSEEIQLVESWVQQGRPR